MGIQGRAGGGISGRIGGGVVGDAEAVRGWGVQGGQHGGGVAEASAGIGAPQGRWGKRMHEEVSRGRVRAEEDG